MKTAFLHYWLTNVRGGEKVLAALADMYPDADVFTHAYRPDHVPFLGTRKVRESFVAAMPFGRRRPQIYLPFMPFASRRLNLDGYDLIVSSESGPIKGIRKPRGACHVCYCHTPMRYLWDLHDEYCRQASLFGKLAMQVFTPYLRRADLRSVESVDAFIANSKFVAGRIKRIYGRESTVVYPPVDVDFFSTPVEGAGRFSDATEPYYLFAGAQVKYKRLDLVVDACAKMGRRLIVAKDVSDEKLRELYAGAKALVFPGIEDFGIVPVEAQAAGTPVIAFGEGGALETVVADETGLFFGEQTVESLCHAIEEFEGRTWERARCRANALRFGGRGFRDGVEKVIGEALRSVTSP